MQTFDKCLDDDGGHELTSRQVISYLAKLLCRANILLYSGRGILSPYNVHLHNCIDLHIHTKAMWVSSKATFSTTDGLLCLNYSCQYIIHGYIPTCYYVYVVAVASLNNLIKQLRKRHNIGRSVRISPVCMELCRWKLLQYRCLQRNECFR